MDVDLNIENYSFQDMVNLFNIPENYTVTDLKKALKIVSRLHPDKSDLPNDYFMFFHNVYKILLNFYKIKNRKVFREDYYDEKEHKLLNKFTKNKNFNKIFNELFEKTMTDKKDDGYGDWLKNHEDVKHHSKNVNTYFEIRHNTIALTNDIKELNSCSGTRLYEDNSNSYSCDIFSKLKYDDVKHVYSETFIPVSNKITQSFKNADELERYRNETIETPLDKSESNKILQNRHKNDDYENMQQLFSLYKNDEKHKKNKNNWWTNFKKLTI